MRDPRVARHLQKHRPGIALGARLGPSFLYAFYMSWKFSPQRVRQPVAKSRHIGRFAFALRFNFPHSSAQARMLSREARGNVGGGVEASIGGSGGSPVCAGGAGAAFGAACWMGAFAGAAGLFVTGAGVRRCAPAPGFCAVPFFSGFVFVAAGARAACG